MTTALYLYLADDSDTARVYLGESRADAPSAPTLDRIRAVVGEGVAHLDEPTIEQIVTAFDLPNDGDTRLASPVLVWRFLRRHEGEGVRLGDEARSAEEAHLGEELRLGEVATSSSAPIEAAVAAAPVEVPRTAEPRQARPWASRAGVAAWRAQLPTPMVSPGRPPSRRPRVVAWGAASAIVTLLVILHLLAAEAPVLGFALGVR